MPQSVKKVIFFIPTLYGGGAERVVSELSCNMPNRVKQYIVVFENKAGYKHKAELIVINADTFISKNLFIKLKQIIRRFIAFRRVVRAIEPDVVLSFLQANTINILVKQFSFGVKKRYRAVISERTATSEIDLIKKGFYGFVNRVWIRMLYKKADDIIAVSCGIKYGLESDFGVNPEKIKVIYNPVDAEKVRRLSLEKMDHPWFEDSVPILVNVGRLAAQKSQRDILLMLAALRQERQCRLVIIGEGGLREDLTFLARRLNIANDVLFTGFQENPFKYVARSDIFILSSIFEGFPNSLVEAMALGCPVIASDCPTGPREILAPGMKNCIEAKGMKEVKYGILFEPGNVQGMLCAVRSLLDNSDMRVRYGELARNRVEDFETHKIVDSYINILKT